MERHILYYLRRCAALSALSLLVSACGMSDDAECPGGPGGGGREAYMRLSLDIPSALPPVWHQARAAAPSGGEDGDRKEDGQTYENAVTDALVFLLPQGTSVNSPADTRILDVLRFSSFTQSGGRWQSETVETAVSTGATYPVIVVANPGDTRWTEVPGLTLGGVRDHVCTGAWTESADGGYSYFLMSSESGGSVTFAEGSSEENPSVAEVDVERVAARVDYKAEGSYTCADPAYAGGTAAIEGAALVNDLTAGSYLLKRVASTVDGTPDYLGDETPQSGVQTNYVIDPWTVLKTAANASSGTPFTLPGGTQTAAQGLYGLYYNTSDKTAAEWKDIVRSGTPVTDPTTQELWQRVGYTLENTTANDEASAAYSTGVVFRARFTPAGLTSKYLNDKPYREGSTFFAVGESLFPTLEDVMLATVGSDVLGMFCETIASGTTAGQLRGVLAQLNADRTGYRAWADTRISGNTDDYTLTADELADLTFRAYASAELGYVLNVTDDDGYTVTVNAGGKDTRAALAEGGVRTYEDAACYYTYWIRHSGDGTAQKGDDGFWHNVMGHAIVRNNIYKISVTSIYSLGGDVPDPDISPVVHVWADRWTMLPDETINM